MNDDRPVASIRMLRHPSMVRFNPMACIKPVTNGAVAPISMMLTEIAPEIVLTSQPNACCSGRIMTPGAARTATPASIEVNTTANTIQA